MLVYRTVEPEASSARATLVALHGRDATLDELVPLTRSLGPDLRVILAEAPRVVYVATVPVSFTWFRTGDPGHVEPASFGDSLYQVEQFVYDVAERHPGEPHPFLLGYDLGAVLALTAARVIPDFLSGVIGICGYLPAISGWSPPMEDLAGLPVLLVEDPADERVPAQLRKRTAKQLAARGADVRLKTLEGACALDPRVEEVVGGWLGTRL
ncbi:MAG TPA: hypothetical protein VNK94_07445 [Gaiellaceae bacterium]|nr:hypothetical protein [Gaiellaceae bacterium]